MRLGFVTTDSREHLRDYRAAMPSFGTAPAALLEGFAGLHDLEVHVLSCARQPMKPEAKLAENIWFHSLYVPRLGWMRTAYQGCIRAVRKKLESIKPHIVHGQGTELDCALDAVFSGFPNLVTIHGNMRPIAKLARARPLSFLWLSARLESFTIPRADGLVCISEHTRRAVASLAKRWWVVPNAVDSTFFDLGPPSDTGALPRILCVGVVCRLKNQVTLIRALDSLAKKHKFEVLFLGRLDADLDYNSEFQRLISERPWCKHVGFAGRAELKGYLRQAALLVLPSFEDNCPMVVLEAMASGVPVVASRVGGLPDLIEDQKTGLFCDPYALPTVAMAVERILTGPAFARNIALAAKARARQRFHPVVVARQHLEIYREVVARK